MGWGGEGDKHACAPVVVTLNVTLAVTPDGGPIFFGLDGTQSQRGFPAGFAAFAFATAFAFAVAAFATAFGFAVAAFAFAFAFGFAVALPELAFSAPRYTAAY